MRLMGSGPGQNRGGAHRAAVDEDGSLRLALDERDEALPWLDGEDDDEEPGLDTRRLAIFVMSLLLFLGLLAGGAWWLWQGANSELVADGSVVEAPPGPYKLRPSDPGGREVAGTGATSFAVAEGRRIEGRIAASPAPPTADIGGPAGAGEAPLTGVGVQIGAYPTREEAQAGWQQLNTRLPPLNGRAHRILEGSADSGTVYRLQVVAESVAAARALCGTLREAGGDCQVKR